MKSFDILAEFRHTIATSESADPRDSIGPTLDRIPGSTSPAALRLLLADCLSALAPTMNGLVRRSTSDPEATPYAPAPKVGKPRKARAAVELRLLRESYPTEDGYLLLGDMTPAQVIAAAEERERLAEQNNAAAKRLRCIADAATRAGAEFIRDTPPDDLQEFER